MEWWLSLLIALACGAFGGVVNALIAGGELYQVRLPGREGKTLTLGLLGPVIVGTGAALLGWATALAEVQPRSLVGGAFLAGVGGASYITNRLRSENLRHAAEDAGAATSEALEVASEALESPDGQTGNQQ